MVLWVHASFWIGGRYPVADPGTLTLLFVGFAVGVIATPGIVYMSRRKDTSAEREMALRVIRVVVGVLLGVIFGVFFGLIHWLAGYQPIGAVFGIDVAWGLGFGLLLGLAEGVVRAYLLGVVFVAWTILWDSALSFVGGAPVGDASTWFTLFIGCVLGAVFGSSDFEVRLRASPPLKGLAVVGTFLGGLVGLIRWMATKDWVSILFGVDVVFGLGVGLLLGLFSLYVPRESA
jgi:hypothetical protein